MKKQIKHFVPIKKAKDGWGTPACNCFQIPGWPNLEALPERGEVAKTRRGVTCGNCRRTKIFRRIK